MDYYFLVLLFIDKVRQKDLLETKKLCLKDTCCHRITLTIKASLFEVNYIEPLSVCVIVGQNLTMEMAPY